MSLLWGQSFFISYIWYQMEVSGWCHASTTFPTVKKPPKPVGLKSDWIRGWDWTAANGKISAPIPHQKLNTGSLTVQPITQSLFWLTSCTVSNECLVLSKCVKCGNFVPPELSVVQKMTYSVLILFCSYNIPSHLWNFPVTLYTTGQYSLNKPAFYCWVSPATDQVSAWHN